MLQWSGNSKLLIHRNGNQECHYIMFCVFFLKVLITIIHERIQRILTSHKFLDSEVKPVSERERRLGTELDITVLFSFVEKFFDWFNVDCAGSLLLHPGFLYLWQKEASHCSGFSCCEVRASVLMAHGLSCCAAYGIFPNQGSSSCALHWQAGSQPLDHQRSPDTSILGRRIFFSKIISFVLHLWIYHIINRVFYWTQQVSKIFVIFGRDRGSLSNSRSKNKTENYWKFIHWNIKFSVKSHAPFPQNNVEKLR